VSLDAVAEFEGAILSDARVTPIQMRGKHAVWAANYAWRIFVMAQRYGRLTVKPVLPRIIGGSDRRDFFVVLMGLDTAPKCVPHFLLPGRKSVYLFDAWPDVHERIRTFVNAFAVNHVFLSSSMAADRLNKSGEGCVFSWIPEGIAPELYRYYPYPDKSIDVLQLGRRYDAYHEAIVSALTLDGKLYLYEKVKGEIIFPTREGFIDGLARSKISVCVPSSITHPKRSGDIETMTIRYLQSMASKCLIVGHAPREMTSLFGYNPVIEIDMRDPVKQLQVIMDNYGDFIPLIERNYAAIQAHHTWRHRWKAITEILFPRS
jgi:hypothetical protein